MAASYKVAYPNVKKDSATRSCGSRLLTNANVKNLYLQAFGRIEKKESISEQDDNLQFLTSVMRGEHTE